MCKMHRKEEQAETEAEKEEEEEEEHFMRHSLKVNNCQCISPQCQCINIDESMLPIRWCFTSASHVF